MCPHTHIHAHTRTDPAYTSHSVAEAMIMKSLHPHPTQQGLALQLEGKYWVAWGTKALGSHIPPMDIFLVNTQCCLHNWNWLDAVRNV